MSVLQFKGVPKTQKTSVKDMSIKWDTSRGSHDTLLALNMDLSNRPACPQGTQLKIKKGNLKGIPIVVLTCDGQSATHGPFIMVSAKSFSTMASKGKKFRRILWFGQIEKGERTGRWVFRDQKGRKVMDGQYRNGKEHGLWLYWKPGGEFSRQEVFNHGQKVWSSTAKNPEGLPPPVEVADFACPGGAVVTGRAGAVNFKACKKLDWRRYVEDREWRGPAVGWTDKGQLIFHAYETEDGKGVVAAWFASGQLFYKVEYRNGIPNGAFLEWYRNGVLSAEAYFKNGKFHGPFRKWASKGGLTKYGAHYHGKKDGHWGWVSMAAKGNVFQKWNRGKLISSEIHGIHGRVRTNSSFTEEGYVIAQMLSPVHRQLFALVSTEVWKKKRRIRLSRVEKARQRLRKKAVCGSINEILQAVLKEAPNRRKARQVTLEGVKSYCARFFDPNRNPATPRRPIKLGCTFSNVTGEAKETGPCIEVTEKDCYREIKKACGM